MKNKTAYTYKRKPTKDDFIYGPTARHCKEFDSAVCFKKNGDLKLRIKCPIDGFIYTRSKNQTIDKRHYVHN